MRPGPIARSPNNLRLTEKNSQGIAWTRWRKKEKVLEYATRTVLSGKNRNDNIRIL